MKRLDSVLDLAADIAIKRFAPYLKTAGDFYEGKRIAARYFFHYEPPKTTAQFDLLDSGHRTTVDLDENWF
jgi:Acetyl-CoA dehydrogenase C-terminal like